MSFKVVLPFEASGESAKYIQTFGGLGAEFLHEQCMNEDNFIKLAKDADAVIIVASLQPVSRRVIENMEKCKLISNTQIGYDDINIEALCPVLKAGQIAMAALDVTDPEPPGSSSPLLSLNNVVLTAHSAFFSPISESERWHRPTEEVARVIRGEWPQEIVNPGAKEKYVQRWGPMNDPS